MYQRFVFISLVDYVRIPSLKVQKFRSLKKKKRKNIKFDLHFITFLIYLYFWLAQLVDRLLIARL